MGEAIQTCQSQSHRSYILSGMVQFLFSVKKDKIQEGGGGSISLPPPPVSLFSFYINVEAIEKYKKVIFFFKSEKNYKFS